MTHYVEPYLKHILFYDWENYYQVGMNSMARIAEDR